MSSKRRNIGRKVRDNRLSKQTQARGILAVPFYKSPRVVMPEEFDTTLHYIVQDVVTAVGGQLASIRFRTEAYDVDPAIASTAMPGFAEFAAFYQRFRTLELGYKFSCANQEAFSLTMIHGYSTSSISSGALAITYAGNPLFSSSILGPATGMNTKTFMNNKSVVQIAGTSQPLYDDLYTGSTTSATLATAGTVYCHLGVVGPVVLTALGVLVTVDISLRIRFYRPNLLIS